MDVATIRFPIVGCTVLWIVLAISSVLAAEGDTSRILDMTYPFDERTISWPNATPFKITRIGWGINAQGYWYASDDYGACVHAGTHADAPAHFYERGRTIDQVPLQEWIGPAVKIDVTAQCAKSRDYALTIADVEAWEMANGRIPDRAWALMYTGIDTRHYPNRKQVLGTTRTGPAALLLLSFPGFSPEVTRFLVTERKITGIGLDTPSIDIGKSKDFQVHRILCEADKLALENVANLDRLPTKGWTLYAMPMPIAGATGAPTRVFAVAP